MYCLLMNGVKKKTNFLSEPPSPLETRSYKWLTIHYLALYLLESVNVFVNVSGNVSGEVPANVYRTSLDAIRRGDSPERQFCFLSYFLLSPTASVSHLAPALRTAPDWPGARLPAPDSGPDWRVQVRGAQWQWLPRSGRFRNTWPRASAGWLASEWGKV